MDQAGRREERDEDQLFGRSARGSRARLDSREAAAISQEVLRKEILVLILARVNLNSSQGTGTALDPMQHETLTSKSDQAWDNPDQVPASSSRLLRSLD